MGSGLIKLYRTPLREGEPVYSIGNIEQGIFEDGNHKGEKKPLLMSLKPTLTEDGRMLWEMMDTPGNRAYCASLLPQRENPPFAYSVVYPNDKEIEKSSDVKAEQEEAKAKRGPGRPWPKKD
jgi:hypothetical protein